MMKGMRTVAALCRELLPDRRTDGALLAAFLSERNEATFLELVRRHGPLVWGVCRRTLPDSSDAEDAFQATFLVLVSQAGKLSARETIGPWLHRVAVWTARNVRRKNARRLARQRELPDAPASAPDADLKADIDGALLSLPARYREPIILCHLQGFSRREAAERLGCPEGTLSSWLDRGLAKLRVRLCALDPALAVAAVAVPAALTANTARAAVSSGAAATVPPAVSSLVEGVLHMLWIKKATAATFALCAVFVVGVGVGLGTRPSSTGAVAQDGPKSRPADPTKPAPPANSDQVSDELTRQIAVAEKRLAIQRNLLKLTSDKLELMRQLNPQAGQPAEERAGQRQLEAELEAGTAELQLLKAKLAKLKADKTAPRQPVGDKETALLKLDELKAQLARIEDERHQLLAQAELAKRALEVIEEKRRALQRVAETLAAEAARDKKAATTGWHFEITVRGEGDEFVIQEAPNDPRRSDRPGAVRTYDLGALTLLLRRAKADPNGPQEVRIRASVNTPNDVLKAVTDACKTAGFATPETVPAPGGDKKTRPVPGATEAPPVTTIDERLLLEQIQRQKVEAELQELLRRRDQELLELKKLRDAAPKP